MDLMNFT